MNDQQLATDLAIAGAMTYELDDYLLDDRLYRQMVVETPSGTKQPKMTLGALLELVDNLSWYRTDLSAEQRKGLVSIENRVGAARRTYRDQWAEKLTREMKALLSSWQWYLDDVGRNPKAREDYASEVHIRNRIDILKSALARADKMTSGEGQQLDQLDSRLQGMWQSGDYVGPSGEEKRYSSERAWWLFGSPAGQD
ncbi:MAG: hypothetical protein U9R25_12525 [Chloroflexota bacterium]|nr:hypothetical protein [Chloroflexota bacterium]